MAAVIVGFAPTIVIAAAPIGTLRSLMVYAQRDVVTVTVYIKLA